MTQILQGGVCLDCVKQMRSFQLQTVVSVDLDQT